MEYLIIVPIFIIFIYGIQRLSKTLHNKTIFFGLLRLVYILYLEPL